MRSDELKFLVIAQDLRISGTSEGIVSRSFLAGLSQVYPQSRIDVVYLRNHNNEDRLDLLPVDSIKSFYLEKKIPSYVILVNKMWWRLVGTSLNDSYHLKNYRRIISKIDFKEYDHIFIRSSGQEFEVIRAARGLPILERSIVNFHDPYPIVWDTGSNRLPRKTEFGQFKEIWDIVESARVCISPSRLLSHDLEHLYGSSKKFYTLPHQYRADVFEKGDQERIRKKEKEISISYHGALQLGRNLQILLDAYQNLINENSYLKAKTELILRLRGGNIKELRDKYNGDNILFLKPVDFAESSLEQKLESDIIIVLENCATHSNILVGKAPFISSLNKPVLSLSPERSEMRRILRTEEYAANCSDKEEICLKLKNLIDRCLERSVFESPFKDYFEPENFKCHLKKILE
ncbi:hypothetical protein ML462_00220 [Gramella lutea]|uniref:Glycosyltransferase n=1 Tax=Christiangramia lutea TaxID=1607951 RepID=A0A9X1UZY8_9FLAO|nr:hypothetical protein [Christiangramia lutea]MCH4821583.1 hypothetical protein [Christiangramia lutea]